MNIARLATIAAVAAAALSTAAVQAAPQEIVKLPRVVITGKSAAPVQTAQKIEPLPRVVVTGLSIEAQLRQQQLAAAKTARRS